MRITVELILSETYSDVEVDEISDIVREAIDEKVGESEYMVQDVRVGIELDDY